MSDTLRFILSAFLTAFGVVSIALSVLGVFKFRFVMNRMHCAAITDTMGLAGILLGLIIASGSMEYIPKLLLILVLYWVGSPIASHMVGRMEINTDKSAGEHMGREEK